jgi:hypothetical protein
VDSEEITTGYTFKTCRQNKKYIKKIRKDDFQISSSHSDIDEIRAVLGYYAQYSGNF